MLIIRQGDTCIASHAMSIINTKPETLATDIAEGTVVDVLARTIVIQVADSAVVLCERLAIGFTLFIDTAHT
jgi:hypothetical protein